MTFVNRYYYEKHENNFANVKYKITFVSNENVIYISFDIFDDVIVIYKPE